MSEVVVESEMFSPPSSGAGPAPSAPDQRPYVRIVEQPASKALRYGINILIFISSVILIYKIVSIAYARMHIYGYARIGLELKC